MKSRLACATALLPLALLLGSAAAQAWTRERPTDALPGRMTKVLALDGGGALVLGYNYKYINSNHVFSDVLVRIGPEGDVSAFSYPDAGALRDVAVRGPEVWILGSKAVLYKNGQQEWKSVPLPESVVCGKEQYSPAGVLEASDVRDSNIVGLQLARAAVTCTDSGTDPRTPRATTALIIHPDQGIGERYEFKELAIGLLVADGDGGFWALVDSREAHYHPDKMDYKRLIAPAWYSKGKWTLWRQRGPVPEGFEIRESQTELPDSNFAAEDGAGGYWLIGSNGRRAHVRPTGVSIAHDAPFGGPGPAAFDRVAGELLNVVNEYRYRKDGDFGELGWFSPDGIVRKEKRVPMPSAARKLDRDMAVDSLSVGKDELWISTAYFLIRRHGTTWTYYWSPAVTASMAKETFAGKWALGALILATPGVFGGASIHGEKYWATTAQTLSGSLFGALPLLLSPFEAQMIMADGPQACLGGGYLGCFFYAGEATAVALFTGLGTFAAGELMKGSRHTGAAFGGAMAGAFSATLSTAVLNLLLSRLLPDGLLTGLDLGLIGSGATMGYQWAGGGPRR